MHKRRKGVKRTERKFYVGEEGIAVIVGVVVPWVCSGGSSTLGV